MMQDSVQFLSVTSCQKSNQFIPFIFFKTKIIRTGERERAVQQTWVSKLFYSLYDRALICCVTFKIRWLDLSLPLLLELCEMEVINTCLRECFTLILNGLTFVKLFESLRCGSVWKFKALLSCGINRPISQGQSCFMWETTNCTSSTIHHHNSDKAKPAGLPVYAIISSCLQYHRLTY